MKIKKKKTHCQMFSMRLCQRNVKSILSGVARRVHCQARCYEFLLLCDTRVKITGMTVNNTFSL